MTIRASIALVVYVTPTTISSIWVQASFKDYFVSAARVGTVYTR